jgi:hypothetical protein
MVLYICDNCDKHFKRKQAYETHNNRKYSCGPKSTTITPASTRTPPKNQNIIKNKSLECMYCKLPFSRSDALTRHIKLRCTVKKQSDDEKEKIYNDLLFKIEEQTKIIQNIAKQNNQLKSQLGKINIKQITKNITIDKSKNIYNSTNINLVAFGKEDLTMITDELCKKILSNGLKCVPTLIDHIHFNEQTPEHCNVYISNIRNKYIMVYDGNSWILKEQDNTISELYDDKKDFLIEKFDVLVDKLSDKTIKKFKRFLDNEEDDKIINGIKKDIKLILYNNRKIPITIRKMFEENFTDKLLEDS